MNEIINGPFKFVKEHSISKWNFGDGLEFFTNGRHDSAFVPLPISPAQPMAVKYLSEVRSRP